MKPGRRVFGLDVSATSSAGVTYAALAVAAACFERSRRGRSVPVSLAAAVMAPGLHAASVLVHHFGHAVFARYTGHPMLGVRFWGGLATSVYPTDEPPLPATVHLTRAAGGPVTSLLLAILVASATSRGGRRGVLAPDLSRFVVLDNFLVLGLGSLLPLSFTDGGTLLRWTHRR